MQRQEYENICKKLELGRTYRHDMRHHLMALEGLAKQGDTEAMTRYIENLNGRFADMEKATYCENSTVNAVVAACIRKAEEANCTITAKINSPREMPFDATHVCVILANALENAVNACEKIQPEEKRHIRLTVELIDNRKLAIAIENPCDTPVSFDADGFPDVPKREGHGIGLKSIHAVAKMYHGFFQCECREGKFCFKAVLFSCQNSVVSPVGKNVGNKKMRKRLASSALFSMLAFFMLINCMPVMAQTLADLPGLGLLVQIADLRSYHSQWGDTSFDAVLPVLKVVEVSTDEDEKADEEEEPLQEEPAAPEVKDSGDAEEVGTTRRDFSFVERLLAEAEGSSGTIFSGDSGTSVNPSSTEPSEEESQSSQPSVESQPDVSVEDPDQPDFPATPTDPSTPSTDLSDGVEDLNQQMEGYIEEMREKFLWYVARKYEGYVGMDVTYEILRNDERMLSIRFDAVLNAGSSGQYSRCFILDKEIGEVLELSDLFQPGSDYISVISAEILRQMTQLQADGIGDYFIPGSIWSESDYFEEIDADQNFYLDDQNQLVIIFDEGEVASNRLGMPEFVIETDLLQDILLPSSIIYCSTD